MAKAKNIKKKLIVSEQTITLENSVFLMFQTSFASFTFASRLNRLYQLNLTRECDMDFDFLTNALPAHCPLFTYYDESNRLFYVLLDYDNTQISKKKYLNAYDKILVILGDYATDQMRRIYADFNEVAHRDVDPYDIYALRLDDLRMEILRDVVTVDYFDYKNHITHRLPNLDGDDYETVRIKRSSEPAPYSQLALLAEFEQEQQEITLSSPSSTKRRVFTLDDPSDLKEEDLIPNTSLIHEEDFLQPLTESAIQLARGRQKSLRDLTKVSKTLLQTIESHLTYEVEMPFSM